MEEKHTHPAALTDPEQGEQLEDRSSGMQEEKEAERERPKHLPAPLGTGRSLVLTGTPLLPALGTARTCHWGNKEPGSHSSSSPYRAQGSSEERDTALGYMPGARCQLPK